MFHFAQPSYDIHSAGLTKQIKLVFKNDLSLFAKSIFFQISQTRKPQIQKLTKCSKHSKVQPQIGGLEKKHGYLTNIFNFQNDN